MYFVYILESLCGRHYYVGLTQDVDARLKADDSGSVPHTSKYRPWALRSYTAFNDRSQAADFEKYLKSGSGRAFARKRY